MLGSLPLLDDDVYVFEASLSMCTAPSPTIFTISFSIHIAVIIVVCTSIHRHLNPNYNADIESGQHSSVSDVAEGSDRNVFEAEEKLAHNVLLYTFVSSLLILVALAFAITSVIYQNKWFGLFCIFVMGICLRCTTEYTVQQKCISTAHCQRRGTTTRWYQFHNAKYSSKYWH